ncbi:hypothetical protein ACVILH_000277 [Bradyrhizobium sp. USDA 4353]
MSVWFAASPRPSFETPACGGLLRMRSEGAARSLSPLSMNTPRGVFMVSVQDRLGCQNLMVRRRAAPSRTMRPIRLDHIATISEQRGLA